MILESIVDKAVNKKEWNAATEKINNYLQETYGTSNLFTNAKLISGRGKYRNYKWWIVGINEAVLKAELKGYTHINLMPYKISFEDFNYIKTDKTEIMCGGNYTRLLWSKAGAEHLPDIDRKTGNIHLEVNGKCSKEVKQLVLVGKKISRQYGPIKEKIRKDNFQYDAPIRNIDNWCFFEPENRQRANRIVAIKIPKICYFPQLDSNENSEKDLDALFKGFLKQICDENIIDKLDIK